MSQDQDPFTGPPIADDPHLSALLREPVRLGEVDPDAETGCADDAVLESLSAAGLRAAAAAIPSQGWRPISTAPKDGTEVDLWGPFVGGARPQRVPDCTWKCLESGEGWYTRGDNGWESLEEIRLRPTHWMPLPAPPQ